ncbi:carbonic anhydrase [Bhargavaea cecembensis]|uniref:carbonic anhydrase n=1 Tax=Bhargavaea cecembensis TaxID=394098 RepID=UPI00058DEC9D|nr:carbonic anhydrase [Bhargavaea cecembensis]
MEQREFVTVINCMDGRVQEPVIQWMKSQYNAKYVDSVTEAGPNKVLLGNDPQKIDSIIERVRVSTDKHGSTVLAIAGHYDCAGHAVDGELKKARIRESVELISTWGLDVEIIGIYVNDKWEVEEVCGRARQPQAKAQ